jgi:steroid delta-isomerase-like uncharacterized protein
MTGDSSNAAQVPEPALEELVRDARLAFNAHDADAFVAVMTEDVVMDHSASPATLRGKDEVRRFYADYVWRAFPDMRLELEDGPFFHPHAPRAALAWRAIGTHDGPLDPPGLAPTGRPVALAVREIVQFREGLASRVHVQLDMADMMRQMGILPGANTRAERAVAALQRLQMKLRRGR